MTNRSALITGASSGIGRALAEVAAADCSIVVVVARHRDQLEELKAGLESRFRTAVIVLDRDLALPAAAEELVRELGVRGIEPDFVINNAGFGDLRPFAQSDWRTVSSMIEVNITALTHLTRLLLPGMISRGSGAIMNVASTAAFQPGPFMAVYYASKAYVLSFTEALAVELEGTGVTVTALCPGPTATGFGAAAGLGRIRLMRLAPVASAEEVARYGYSAMKKGTTVAIPGILNKLAAFSTRFGPRKLAARMVAGLHKE